jgi:chemotaxis protein methyltransferase CheR
LPQELLEKYFELQNGMYRLNPVLKRLVEFRRHDLLADDFEPNLDLIICRNVVIYFTEMAKLTLYQKFNEALRPGGYILVGGTEPLLNYRQLGFESVIPSFYRKPGLPAEGSIEQ